MHSAIIGVIAGVNHYSTTPAIPPPSIWGPLTPRYLNANENWTIALKIDTDRAGVWIATFNELQILRSTDNGVTWSPLSDGLGTGFGMVALATDRSGVWMIGGAAGKVLRSTDNGVTWTSLTDGFGGPTFTVRHFATDFNGVWIAVLTSGYAYRSTDNGVTWSSLPRYLSSGTAGGNAPIIVTDASGVWIYGAGNGTASRSFDNGATFSALPINLSIDVPSTADIYSFATDFNGNWLSGTSEADICRSADSGATWEYLGSGAGTLASGPTYAIVHDGGQSFVIGFDGGYASYTTDLGDSWNVLTRGLNSGGGSTSINAIVTDGAGRWIATTAGGYAAISPPL